MKKVEPIRDKRKIAAIKNMLTGAERMFENGIDPLTGAVCNPAEVWAMCDEMFDALAPWLSQFNGEGRT